MSEKIPYCGVCVKSGYTIAQLRKRVEAMEMVTRKLIEEAECVYLDHIQSRPKFEQLGKAIDVALKEIEG